MCTILSAWILLATSSFLLLRQTSSPMEETENNTQVDISMSNETNHPPTNSSEGLPSIDLLNQMSPLKLSPPEGLHIHLLCNKNEHFLLRYT